MDNLRLDGGLTYRRRRTLGLTLRQQEFFGERMRETLHLVAPVDHQGLGDLDGGGVGGIEIKHRSSRAGIEFLFAFFAQKISHRHRDIAKIDVYRTRALTLVANGAMVGNVGEFIEVAQRHATAGLFLVEKGLDQQ